MVVHRTACLNRCSAQGATPPTGALCLVTLLVMAVFMFCGRLPDTARPPATTGAHHDCQSGGSRDARDVWLGVKALHAQERSTPVNQIVEVPSLSDQFEWWRHREHDSTARPSRLRKRCLDSAVSGRYTFLNVPTRYGASSTRPPMEGERSQCPPFKGGFVDCEPYRVGHQGVWMCLHIICASMQQPQLELCVDG